MKDSWVSDTVLPQEGTLAMEQLPASPATSQFNNSAPESPPPPPNKSTQLSPNSMQHGNNKSCHAEQNDSDWCGPDVNQVSNPHTPCDNQPMDTSEHIETNDDEEQIVPQSVANCSVLQRTRADEQMTVVEEQSETSHVSSGIMKLGIKDLLGDADHQRENIESGKATASSSRVNVITSTSSDQNLSKNTSSSKWYGFQKQEHAIFGQEHAIFGPLARSHVSVAESHSSPSFVPKFKGRAGSPVIIHKKFDYQKKLTLNLSNTPLNLCKRSPSTQSSCSKSNCPETESTPIDLTKKVTSKDNDVQCQAPEIKPESWSTVKRNQNFFIGKAIHSPFSYGFKSEIDHYPAPRMPHFLLPRASSCSPSGSSDHSSSSAISSMEQRSDAEGTPDVKPATEMLSTLHHHDGIGLVPSPLAIGERDIKPPMPRLPHFDPAQLNDYYMRQFATKLEGGIYTMPNLAMAQFGGYTTRFGQPHQPSSPSKGKNAKPDKMFVCQECGAVFKHRHHVVRHMRSHSGERPFKCDECGATFARKCILTNHKRTHTGEKPFICTECGDTFSRKHHLVIHRRTHTGEKPYRCGQCSAAFARSHHLNRHRKTHIKIDTLDYPQLPAGLAPNQMQALPTMLPILPPTLFPSTLSSESTEMQTQELQEQTQVEKGETSHSEPAANSCRINRENSVAENNPDGVRDPASSN